MSTRRYLQYLSGVGLLSLVLLSVDTVHKLVLVPEIPPLTIPVYLSIAPQIDEAALRVLSQTSIRWMDLGDRCLYTTDQTGFPVRKVDLGLERTAPCP